MEGGAGSTHKAVDTAMLREHLRGCLPRILEDALGPVRRFHVTEMQALSDNIAARVIESARVVSDVHKVVTTCGLFEATKGAAISSGTATVGDPDTDSVLSASFSTDTIGCVVTVFLSQL
jgi:hypothetical protein